MKSRLKIVMRFICIAFLLHSLIGITLFADSASAALPQVYVTVDSNRPTGVSDSSFGFMLDFDWTQFRDRSVQRQLADDANFKLVRFFDRILGPRDYRRGVGPCTYWSEATKTGTFDWAQTDSFVRKIFDSGAEPLICLSQWRPEYDPHGWRSAIPPGMAINPSTLLPYPDSYAAFAAAWVQHFKNVGLPVRYYEIFNEIQTYIGWSPPGNQERVANFVKLFNAAYTKMHQVNPQVRVSTDCSLERHFFPYFLENGVGIDFLDFHKYDAWKYPQYSNSEMLTKAEGRYFVTDGAAYSISEARQKWFNKHGEWLPAILGESNFNAAYADGTDPRIQQMVGAVRTALVSRMGILNGLTYNLYYCFSSSRSYESRQPTGGSGFGMINSDNNNPWYPYYVQKMIATNLSPNDKILQSSVNNNYFRTIAWNHNGKINVLVISKSRQDYTLKIQGLTGTITYEKIDESVSWTTPKVQTGQFGEYLTLNGYAVALLQASGSTPSPTPPLSEDSFESGDFSWWSGTSTSSGETATVASYNAYHGTFHGRFTSNGGSGFEYAYCYKAVNEDEIYARGFFYIASGLSLSDNADRFYFLRFRAGGQSLAGAGIRRYNGVDRWILYARQGSGWAGPVYATSSPIEEDRWYCIELHWKEHASQGLVEMYVDGEKILEITGLNTAYYGNADSVNFGLISATNVQNSLIVYGDYFAASNNYIGP